MKNETEGKLIELARNVIRARLYNRQSRMIDRRIAKFVHNHSHSGANELQNGILTIRAERMNFQVTDEDIEREINKVR